MGSLAVIAIALLLALDSSGRSEGPPASRLAFARSVSAGDDAVFALSVSRSRGLAVAGRRDGQVIVRDAWTWEEVRRFPAHEGSCYAAVMSPDGRTLATAGLDGSVKLWNAVAWTADRTLRERGGPVVALAFASGGRRLVAAGPDGAQAWDLEGGSALLPGAAASVAAAGDRAGTGGADGPVRLWDLATGKELRTLKAHAGVVAAVAFQPGGRFVVSAGADRSIHAWEVSTGRKVRTFAGHPGPVRALAFLPGGREVASAGTDGVRVWDLSSGREVRALAMNGIAACAISVGVGSRPLVVTGGDNRAWIWGAGEKGEEMPADARPMGFLGVSYVDGGGALVQAVFPDSPAQQTGFAVGDVIVGVDDTPVEKSDDFLNYMRRSHEGDDVHFRVRRGEETKVVRVKFGRWRDR